MPAVLGHALLGLDVASLGAGGMRAGAAFGPPSALARAVVAAVLATAAAVGEALALGLAGLGGSPVALSLAALATSAIVHRLLPPPASPAATALAGWWSGLTAPQRAAAGALAGAVLAWIAWQLRHPAIGFDSTYYHLPEIVLWVQSGHPGAIEDVLPGLPVGNYPLTAEVTVAWGMGIARSFVPFTLFPWLTLALTAAAGWLGLRALAVPRWAAGLAVAALCTSPWLLGWQSNGSLTDGPALAWLVACAALCALARQRPLLLAPAVLAGGLAVGTKTTVLPELLVVLAAGLYAARGGLAVSTVRRAIAGAMVAALAVGGCWYARNLILHGSPFWPFAAAPWGDPTPPLIDVARTTFLMRPEATIDRIGDAYVHRFGGGLLLLAGGLVAPLLAPRRRVMAAAAVVAGGLLIWARSPVTGVRPEPGLEETVFSATRYLLPVVAAAVAALAVAAGERRRPASIVAGALLAAAAVVDLRQTFALGYPVVPSVSTPLAGAVAGALLGVAAARVPGRLPRVAGPALAVALGALLALGAGGYVERHYAQAGPAPLRALVADPGFRSGSDPVASVLPLAAPLAGDRLQHRLDAVPPSCAEIERRARSAWLVVYGTLGRPVPERLAGCLARAPAFSDRSYRVYRPR